MVKVILNISVGRELIDDTLNDYNDTPLTYAIQFDGDLNLVKLLITAGANFKKLGDGKTPLQWAVEKGKIDIANYLKTLK